MSLIRKLFSKRAQLPKTDSSDWQTKSDLSFFELEQRTVFDGAMAATADSAVEAAENEGAVATENMEGEGNSSGDLVAGNDLVEALGLLPDFGAQATEIVFVDTSVENYQQIVDGILNQQDSTRVFDVILLENDRDGIEQITESLALHSQLDAVHIISHGSGASVTLGNSTLDADSLESYGTSIQGWGTSFSETGDLLVYGCDLASIEAGEDLIDALAKLTDADVSASDDLTGHESLGGDWDLEYATGSIEADIAVGLQTQSEWESVLATVVVDTTNDANNGDTSSIANLIASDGGDGISLREAIIAANNTVGTDTIEFNISAALVGGAHTINLSSALGDITDTVIIDGTTDPDYSTTPIIELDGSSAGAVSGITLSTGSDGSTIRGLVINQFGQHGIYITGSNSNSIVGNFIGTDRTGSVDLGNSGYGVNIESGSTSNTIGGTAASQRNIISGNNAGGIYVTGVGTNNNAIEGNFIGTTVSGTVSLSNSGNNIEINGGAVGTIVGGSVVGAGNTISSAGFDGISVWGFNTTGTIIRGNAIGTDSTGTVNLGNANFGVALSGDTFGNEVGGVGTNDGNLIYNSGADGISVFDSGTFNNSLLGNQLANNSGLGIDLGNDGITSNDSGDGDIGSNNLQNFPVLFTAVNNAGDLDITGDLNSNPSTTYRIEFFHNPLGSEDATGYGEGVNFIGSVTVTTDALGDASINTTLVGVVIPNNDRISATATVDLGGGLYGDTSEFSMNIIAASGGNVLPVIDLNDDGTTPDTSWSATFTEGDVPIAVTDTDVSIIDPDDTSFSFLDVVLGGFVDTTSERFSVGGTTIPYGTPFSPTVIVGGTTFLIDYDGDQSLGINRSGGGDMPASDLLALIASITYEHTSGNPTAGDRTFDFVINDGDGNSKIAVSTITVIVPTATFQQGVSGYTGTQDTFIDEFQPITDKGNEITVDIDLFDGGTDATTQGLLRFDNIFGPAAGQIPVGASITSAELTVNVTNVSNSAAQITLHRMLVNWNEASTWDSMVNGVATDDVEASSTIDSTIVSPDILGAQTFTGLAATLQAWSDGATNYGWFIASDNDNGWDFASSEHGTVAFRPILTVEYSINAAPTANDDADTTPENTAVVIDVTGNDTDPDGDTITVLDVSNPANGTAVNNGDGTITYTPDPAFNGADSFEYRITDGNDTTTHYWNFDGGAATDVIGSNDGTLTGTTLVNGDIGRCAGV